MSQSNQKVWLAYYTELQMHCKDCIYYHVQSFENMRNPMQTTHRCKKLAETIQPHLPEYSRGYYPRLDVGCICPLSGKMVTSKSFSEIQALANSTVVRSNEMVCCGTKVQLTAINDHMFRGHCPVCGKSVVIQL